MNTNITQGLNSNHKVQSSNLKVQTSKFKPQNSNLKIQTSKFKPQSSKLKVQSSKFKVSTDACHHLQCEDSVACKNAKH